MLNNSEKDGPLKIILLSIMLLCLNFFSFPIRINFLCWEFNYKTTVTTSHYSEINFHSGSLQRLGVHFTYTP